MNRTAEPRKFDGAGVVFRPDMVGINREASFQPRRHSAVSESVSRFISTLHLSRSQDWIAIVGPLERISAKEFCRPVPNARCRVELFSDRPGSNEEMEQHSSRVGFGRLNTLVCSGQISRVLLATPANETERIASVMTQLEGMAVDVDFVLEGIRTHSRVDLGGENVSIARILRRPLTSSQALIKSILDKVGALLLLLLLAPLLVCIALLVKLTSEGPVLFRQKRFGLNNEAFGVLKFRTLHHRHSDPNSQQPVKRQDARVTSVGKYLRALSLDELPQLLNVLKGDMSLVGPRPLPVGLNVEGRPCSEFPHYRARHRVRPGITGLAQVNGRRGGMQVAEDLNKRLSFDLAYIDNYSLLLDAKIVLVTCFALLKPNNAY
jgi:exopolysaccharide biosynthesis polyprenyl glycosylphosphotransferase